MLKAKTFYGANVFMSPKLVPPEIFDALHDALKNNGAEVFLSSDLSRSGPDDFHIISSPDHEKFEDLRAKGYNLIGPQCVFSCAEEHRALPKQGFTCCLAMDGVKVLASGFDANEKGKMEKLVTAMGGVFHSKASLDVSFVIAKNVLASKYKDGCLLNVNDHILYSPLPCWIPFPGFENFRFCVSQYEEKDRLLLRNLCFVLGTKLVERLTNKVTHLICKFASGPKYEAACKWGIHTITSDWIYDCVKQNKLVPLNQFSPKEITAEDQEAGLCTVSQFPTQAVRMISGDIPSPFPSQLEETKTSLTGIIGSRTKSFREGAKHTSALYKKARLLEDDGQRDLLSSAVHPSVSITNANSIRDDVSKDTDEVSHVVPDVASAIEDLLEQTSKIHDQKSPGSTGCDESLLPSNCSTLGQDHSDTHSIVGLSKHWLNRSKDDNHNSFGDGNMGMHDGFSETQTDSQVVGYEEDLSGRQMLIDRVRTRSNMT